ncbi:unnamed protein product [Rhizophagus irregularis]|nr:unnamed protein product [Rhizophagus irregularis]
MATSTSTHDSDDISSDTSDITVYFDEEVFKEEEGTNELIEKMPDDSDDDGYDGYGGYDRGYYYRDGMKEKSLSPIISPVTA